MCLGGSFYSNKKENLSFFLNAEKAVVAGVQNSRLQFVPPAFGGERMGWMTS